VDTLTVTKDKWYCVELHWKQGTAGAVELYIDGTRVIQRTNVNTGYYGKATAVIVGLSSATGVQNRMEVYADDCRISRTYNGP
jgi:hypothetical protein